MKFKERTQSGPQDEYFLELEREKVAIASGEFSADALHGLGRMINSLTSAVERDPASEISMKSYEGTILQAIDTYEQMDYADPADGIGSISPSDMRRVLREYDCMINRYSRVHWEIIARLLLWTSNKMKSDEGSHVAY